MATRRGPRFKECRWVGVNAIGNPKAMKRVSTHGNLRRTKPSDVIALHESSRKVEVFCNNFREFGGFSVPYIERNTEELSAKFTRLPEREEIPVEVNDRQIIEFYSR